MVPVADPLIQGSLGRRSGRDAPLGLLHKLGIQMDELGFRSRERVVATTAGISLVCCFTTTAPPVAFVR